MSDRDSATNPYEPPLEAISVQEGRLSLPLGKVFWRLNFATLAVNALLIGAPLLYQWAEGTTRPFGPNLFKTPSIGLGLFGGMISVFAVAYGLSYVHRVSARNYTRRYNEIRERPYEFYGRTMMIGILLAISTLTAFVSCCIPISLPFISYSAGGGTSGNTTPATVLAVLVALAVGGFIIYKLLPREDLASPR